MWSSVAAPGPVYVGGLLPWPQVPLQGLEPVTRYAILDLAEAVHIASVIVLLLLIPAHVGAALKHPYWANHDVLRGIPPEIPDGEGSQAAPPSRTTPPSIPKESYTGETETYRNTQGTRA